MSRTLAESFRFYGCDPSNPASLDRFAFQLIVEDVYCPSELEGDVISPSGKCEWSKMRAWANEVIDRVSFEQVSLIFEDPLPADCSILFEGFNTDPENPKYRMVIRLGSQGYFLLRVDPDSINSGRVRLISAYPVTEQNIESAREKYQADSTISLAEWVLVNYHRKRDWEDING